MAIGRLSKNTTNNIQHTTQHTTKMSRHWLRQYTTYDIDAKKPFKPYRMTKNSFKIFALPKPPIWRPRSPIWRFWQYQIFEWIFSHFRKFYDLWLSIFCWLKKLKILMLFVAFNVVCCVVCWMFYVEFQCCDICRDTGQST